MEQNQQNNINYEVKDIANNNIDDDIIYYMSLKTISRDRSSSNGLSSSSNISESSNISSTFSSNTYPDNLNKNDNKISSNYLKYKDIYDKGTKSKSKTLKNWKKEYENYLKEDILKEINAMEYIKSQYSNNSNTYFLLEIQYNKYTVGELNMIADYYGIRINKNNNPENNNENLLKIDLIHNIILYEMDKLNFSKVYKRRKLWACLKEIKKDNYLSKYLVL